MKAIYSCKLYRASNHKDWITAALELPQNYELVKQLRSYLDPEYQTREYLEDAESNPASETTDSAQDNATGTTSSGSGTASAGGTSAAGSPTNFSDTVFDDGDFDGDESQSEEITDALNAVADDSSESDEGPVEDVSETSQVSGEPVSAGTALYTPPQQCGIDLNDLVQEIKGTLNAISETSGVSRCMCKDDTELWIYYEDKSNLNNVMNYVIEALNRANYSYLSFSRLARSDNAIVFDIQVSTTDVNDKGDDTDAKRQDSSNN